MYEFVLNLLYVYASKLRFNSSNYAGIHFFDHIMNPILQRDLPQSMEIFSSIENFMNSIGIVYLSKNSNELSLLSSSIDTKFIKELSYFEKKRRLLKNTLVTICACLRRYNERKNKSNAIDNIWATHIPNLFRFCLSTIRFCHSLSNFTYLRQFPCLAKVTSLGIEEKMLILGIIFHNIQVLIRKKSKYLPTSWKVKSIKSVIGILAPEKRATDVLLSWPIYWGIVFTAIQTLAVN